MDDYVSIGKASRVLGVHPDTLRLWEKKGEIKSIRTKGNHRRFRVSDIRQMLIPLGFEKPQFDKILKWDDLLSDYGKLREWLIFHEKTDPVFAEAIAYAKRYSCEVLWVYQFVLVAVLDAKVSKETLRWTKKDAGV